MSPVEHPSGLEHPAPKLQGLQEPLQQTPPAHGVPSGWLVSPPQTGWPVEQETIPVAQASEG